MTQEQREVLRGYLEEIPGAHVEQIHFLAGGNISKSELTVVSVQQEGDRWYRYIDQISQDGRTEYKTVELSGNPFETEKVTA